MKPYFLFPSSPFDPKMIDPMFQDQAIALKMAGFSMGVIDFESETIYGKLLGEEAVVFRGWMLSEKEYDVLVEQIDLMGGKAFTTKEQYYATHHMPNWCDVLRGITADTMFIDLELFEEIPIVPMCVEINATGWAEVFIKDYVKSLKTGEKPILKTPVKPEDLKRVIDNMRKYRGTVEGGLTIRQFEDYVPNSEKRFYVINGKFYGQEHSFDTRVMSLLIRVARDVPSPFFSVDIAQRTDGHFRVVEVGDGQVSDLVGWTNERFAEIWK